MFRRADGSTIRFPGQIKVWCGPYSDIVSRRALHVAVFSGRGYARTYWRLWAVPATVKAGRPIRFPIGFAWTRPTGAEIFVGDGATGNELSTEEEEGKGTITFARIGCSLGHAVEFTASGRLGSEFFDGKSIRVSGNFRGVVGRPPPGF